MKRTKKFLSMLLAIVMVIGLLPTATFADEADPAPTATIVVKKVDGEGAPLAGATITMSQRIDGVPDYTAVSDETGLATFENIPDGAGYYIWESEAPAGYQLAEETYMLDIIDGVGIEYGEPGPDFPDGQKEYDNNDPFVFKNEQYKATFYVTKTDGEAALAGAKFKLENTVAGRDGYTATSDAEGKVTFTDVVDGEYILSETAAPAGYNKSDVVMYFKVENGEVKYSSDRNSYVAYGDTLSIVNTEIPTASFSVTKIDEYEGALGGAVFHLTKEGAAEPAYEATSDAETGMVSFTGVVDGTYILSEATAPAGYVKTEKTWKFLINTAEEDPHNVVKIFAEEGYIGYEGLLPIKNEPIPPVTATIVVKKTDDAGDALPGAKFILETDSNEHEATSDANGLVTFEDVAPGYYVLTEVEAPAGYIKSESSWNFTVRDDGTVNGFSEAQPNGYPYSNEQPLVVENEKIQPMTIEFPFTKKVVKGGNVNPGAATFQFEALFPYMDISETSITASAAPVATNGTGEYEGTLVITLAEEDLGSLAEGFLLREIKGNAANWTYDETVWYIAPTLLPTSEEDAAAEYSFFKAIYVEGEEGGDAEGYFDIDYESGPQDEIIFTNTYTKNSSGGGGSSKPVLNKEDHFAFLTGYPDGSFGPNRNMTRGEVATMFANLLTEKMKPGKVYENTFTDVPADLWCANYIGYVQQFGLISGYEDGSFRPDAPITRAEFATIACRFEELTEGTKTFSDVPETHWAYRFIRYAAHRGWVSGYEDGTFKPDQYITRAEVVTVTCQLLERIPDKDFIEKKLDKMKNFLDIDQHWAYWNILEATNGHDYTKKNSKETWSDLHK